MTHRYLTATRLLSALAIAILVMPSVNAAISGSSSSALSIGDSALGTQSTSTGTSLGLSATTNEKFTTEDLATMRERSKAVVDDIEATDAEIAKLTKSGKTDAETKKKLKELAKKKADLEELYTVLASLMLQARDDIRETTDGGINTGTGTGTDTSSGSGSSGTGGMGDMIKQVALNSLLQGLMGGNNSALNNFTNTLMGGGTDTGTGIAVNTDTGSGTGNTGDTTGTPAQPDDTKPAAEEDLPICGPSTETDNSPGRKKAETGSTEGTRKATSNATGSTTDTNPGKMEDDYAGPAQKEFPGKDKDDKADTSKDKDDENPKCRSPIVVNTPNPHETGMGTGTQSRKITSEADARKYVGKYWCDNSNSNCAGNRMECATLTKYFCPEVGRAGTWQGGQVVKGGNLAVGTCIATFSQNGNYGPRNAPGGASGKSHTGVYLGQNSEGIRILHQWNNSGGAKITTIPWSAWGGRTAQGGDTFRVIGSLNVFKGIDWYLPRITIAFNIPLGEGLAKSARHAYNEYQL